MEIMGAISKSRKNVVREGDTRGEREGMIAGYFSEFFLLPACVPFFPVTITFKRLLRGLTVMCRENCLCYKSVCVDKVSNEEAFFLLFWKQGPTL